MVLESMIIDDTQGFESEPRIYTQISPALRSERSGLMMAGHQYRIRKLTPFECWRLMGFSDKDYQKAEGVNSNTQLYKQAGNSLVKIVMIAILSQLNIKGVRAWNSIDLKERNEAVEKSADFGQTGFQD